VRAPCVNAADHIVSTAAAYRLQQMPYTGLAVGFLLLAVLVGACTPVASRPWVAVLLAAAMVATQFAFLVSSS